jgi:hypothetical protein
VNQDSPIPSFDLLQRLAPAVRPMTPRAVAARAAQPLFESRAFDELLEQAFSGQIHSGQPVQCACELESPLTAAQLQRLADAADRAEASGAQRALMMLDGRGFVLDVAARNIVAEMRPEDPRTVLHVDTAMVVPATDGQFPAASTLPASLPPRNLALAQLLSAVDSHQRPVEPRSNPAPASPR